MEIQRSWLKYKKHIKNFLTASGNGDLDKVRRLIDSGVNIELYSSNLKMTALMTASSKGHVDIVRFLLDSGANINAQNIVGRTPLIIAIARKHNDIIALLIDARADVDIQDVHGVTALMEAVRLDNIDAVRKLLDANASINIMDKAGDTALSYAIRRRNVNIIKELIQKHAIFSEKDLIKIRDMPHMFKQEIQSFLLTQPIQYKRLISGALYNWEKLLSGLTPAAPQVYYPHPLLSVRSPQKQTQKQTQKQSPKIKDLEKIFTPSTTRSTIQRSYFPLFFSSDDAKFYQQHHKDETPHKTPLQQKGSTLNPRAESVTPSSIKKTQKQKDHQK